MSNPARFNSCFTMYCTVLLLIRSLRSLKNKASLELDLIAILGRTFRYSLIELMQALFKYIVRSLFPFPITFNLQSLKFISLILIFTSSDKRIPQFKNKVIIA